MCETSEQTDRNTDVQNTATSADEDVGTMQSATADEQLHSDDVINKQPAKNDKVVRAHQQHHRAGQKSTDFKIKIVERPAWRRF